MVFKALPAVNDNFYITLLLLVDFGRATRPCVAKFSIQPLVKHPEKKYVIPKESNSVRPRPKYLLAVGILRDTCT
jgi:hypothetical protein